MLAPPPLSLLARQFQSPLLSLGLLVPIAVQVGEAQHLRPVERSTKSEAMGEPMRLLLVDLDDMGFDLLRATPTPTLDWLEANGRFFANFTTAPVCAPTRAMMNTGAFPSHPDLLMGSNPMFLDSFSMPTSPLEPLASVIAGAGFTTAKVGKWHLAPEIDPTHPLRCGWQHYLGVISNLGNGSPDKSYSNYNKWIDGVGLRQAGIYLTTDETDDAVALLQARVDFVSLSYHAPHAPLHVPPAALHSISPTDTDFDKTRAMLAACDTELARVLAEATTGGYHVIVFGDNGTASGIGGGKGSLFDEGIVNPCWAIGPTFVPGVDATRVSATDLYDTVGELFGVDVSARTRGPHSSSFAASLRGAVDYRRWTYSERFRGLGVDPRTGQFPWRRALRGARYKLVRNEVILGDRLFDLATDPDENSNLLNALPLSPSAQRAYDYFQDVMDRL